MVKLEHDELEEYISDGIDSRYSNTGVPNWHENANYLVGDRVRFNGAEYRCRQSHISIQDWIPTAAQALWEKVK